jgi:hypothetical protein
MYIRSATVMLEKGVLDFEMELFEKGVRECRSETASE